MKYELNFKSLVLITIQLPFCTFYKFICYILSKFSRFLFSYEPIQSIMEARGAYFSPNLTPIDNMEYKYLEKNLTCIFLSLSIFSLHEGVVL